MNPAGRKVLVVGLGRSGEAAARFLCGKGARVTCSDVRCREDLGEERVRRLEQAGCALRLGRQEPGDFLDPDLIVVSPGVPLTLPPLREALEAGVEVIGEMELAARFVDAPLVAVTGTNGKSTTVSLIDHLLAVAGVPHWTGGNIGNPLTEYLLGGRGPAGALPSPRVFVLEVSSFQLETVHRFRPRIAVWTNLSPDHLDRYPDMESYAEAKARVFMNQTEQDTAVVPFEDPWLRDRRDRIRASVFQFGHGPGPDPGAWVENGDVRLRLEPGGPEERYATGRFRLAGRHNLENLMMAVTVARLCGAPRGRIQEGLESFRGLAHRQEYVGEKGGVRYVNDSKATTVASVLCALEALEGPVLLLAGGKDKGGSYTPLRGALKDKVRALYLFGQAAGRMREELEGSCEIVMAGSLDEAVRRAGRRARPGDTVLLSPACSSFDMFRDYEERGDLYKQRVLEMVRGSGGTGSTRCRAQGG